MLTPGAQLHADCRVLGWSASAFAERIDASPRLVQRWWADAHGYTPPDDVLAYARACATAVAAIRLPAWKRR